MLCLSAGIANGMCLLYVILWRVLSRRTMDRMLEGLASRFMACSHLQRPAREDF